jgi:hypothetical protein
MQTKPSVFFLKTHVGFGAHANIQSMTEQWFIFLDTETVHVFNAFESYLRLNCLENNPRKQHSGPDRFLRSQPFGLL